MKILLIAMAFVLYPFPALAESWMFVTALSDGSSVSIDTDSVKRSFKEINRISVQIQVESLGSRATARMSGNCQTGSWRVSSGRKNGLTVTLAQNTGDSVLERACSMPYQVTQPRL